MRPGDNSSHDPQFLVAANQADPRWQRYACSTFLRLGRPVLARRFLTGVVGHGCPAIRLK